MPHSRGFGLVALAVGCAPKAGNLWSAERAGVREDPFIAWGREMRLP